MHQIDLKEISDEQLLTLVKEDNHLAFQQIYNRYWEKLYSNTYNVLNDKSLSEDVLHDVFLDIWVRRDEIKIQNLAAYLFKAVRNNALLKIRNEKFIAFNLSMIERLEQIPEIELYLNQKELKSTIDIEIKKLPARCREIFYMSRYQDYSISEIAAHFNISHRTVENQIHVALKHLRTNLGPTLFILLFF